MESQVHVSGLFTILVATNLILLIALLWLWLAQYRKRSRDIRLLAQDAIRAGAWDYRPLIGKLYLNERKHWKTSMGRRFRRLALTIAEFESYVHPDDLPGMQRAYNDYIDSGGKGELEVEYRLRGKEGQHHWIFSKSRAVEWDENGTPSRIVGMDINIETLKEAQEQLHQSELKFKTIFENAPYAISINNLEDGKYIEANRAFLSVQGISREELQRLDPVALGVISREGEKRLYDEFAEKGFLTNHEIEVVGKEGERRYINLSWAPMEIEGRKQILTIAENITEKKRAKDALIESELRFRMLFRMAPFPMAYISRNGDILDVNDRLMKEMGHSWKDVPTLIHAWDLFLPDPMLRREITSKWKNDLEKAISDNSDMDPIECPLRYMDGSMHDVIVSTRLINEDIIISFFDITDRKRAEAEREKLQEQLHQSQKMEAIGMLAGGVAHDFNNMLGGIMGYTELMMMEMSTDDPHRAKLESILKAAQRSANLARQLLAFARKQTIAPVLLDINESVSSVLKMLQRLIGESIELVWKPGGAACTVRMDPTQLDQILVNFCVNAKDAITDVGNITIETDTVFLDEDHCAARTYFKPGEYVMLAVSDSGSGMDKETMEHIFEPFYTTKAHGRGTGLGLSTVYGIVKQNNGFIDVYSEPGKGTTFRIYIPPAAGEAAAGRTENLEKYPRGGGETVLIVEDDETVLRMSAMMLEQLGYSVLSAGTPEEGLGMAEEYRTDIQALITDVVMPGMNGRDLADQLKRTVPEIKVLFMSGYTATVIAHQGVLDEGVYFIQKPFSTRDLACAMREMLD